MRCAVTLLHAEKTGIFLPCNGLAVTVPHFAGATASPLGFSPISPVIRFSHSYVHGLTI